MKNSSGRKNDISQMFEKVAAFINNPDDNLKPKTSPARPEKAEASELIEQPAPLVIDPPEKTMKVLIISDIPKPGIATQFTAYTHLQPVILCISSQNMVTDSNVIYLSGDEALESSRTSYFKNQLGAYVSALKPDLILVQNIDEPELIVVLKNILPDVKILIDATFGLEQFQGSDSLYQLAHMEYADFYISNREISNFTKPAIFPLESGANMAVAIAAFLPADHSQS